MSLVKLTASRKLCARIYPTIYTSIRNHWNKDYKPSPYPKNETEFEAAAKKYNLSREDYKPFPNDGSGSGDYPDLPLISADSKDPNYPWDYPEHRRNFGETINASQDLISEDRVDVTTKHRYSTAQQYTQFIGWMGLMAALMWYFEDKKAFVGVAEKQYPTRGVKHYTFETREKPCN